MPQKKKEYVYESKYQQIALEIAERIADGRYSVGEKLSARSTLASNFGVSPETARKAVNILVDLDIMNIYHGSGTYVASQKKAIAFLKHYKSAKSLKELNGELMDRVKIQQEGLDRISTLMEEMINQTTRSITLEPLSPYEIRVNHNCICLGRTIGELNVWQETGATIVAIERNDTMTVSPGPYAVVKQDDIIYFIGEPASRQRMVTLFFTGEEESQEDK